MGSTIIQWGAVSGHLGLGVKYEWTDPGPLSEYVDLTVKYYVRSIGWGYNNDAQTLTYNSTQIVGYKNYNLTVNPGTGNTADVLISTVENITIPIYHNSQKTYTFGGRISGAYDGSAPSVTSTWTAPKRPASIPDAPNIAVTNVTSTSARIGIGTVSGNGSDVLEYQGQYAKNSTFTDSVVTWSGGAITPNNLVAGTTYYTRARARNSLGWSSYSSTLSFTTGGSVPGIPTNLLTSNITDSDFTLSWTAPSDGGSAINYYDIQVAENYTFSLGVQNFKSTSSSTLVGWLPPGTYYVRVRAVNGVGSGTYSSFVKVELKYGTPSIVSPKNGSTVNKSHIDVSVQAYGVTDGRKTITVEASKSNTFSSGVLTATVKPLAGNDYIFNVSNIATYLDSGTWYFRAKVSSSTETSPWSQIVSLNIAHAPTASIVYPTGGLVDKWNYSIKFSWKFSDVSGDSQSAYRVVIENVATNEVVLDTLKVNSSVQYTNRSIPESLKNQTLRWKVAVWDKGGAVSQFSGYGIFTLSDPPIVSIVTPASGQVVTTGTPFFSWDASIPSGGMQEEYIVSVYDASDNNLVWKTQKVSTDNKVRPASAILANNKSYYFTIGVWDTYRIFGSQTANFDVQYVAPNPLSYEINSNLLDTNGYIFVDWSNSEYDASFVSFKVYRKEIMDEEYQLIATITNQSVTYYKDYMVVSGGSYMYAVTQTAIRYGNEVESPLGYMIENGSQVEDNRVANAYSSRYWLINAANKNESILLPNVISDDVTLEFEQESFNIIGRGRHVDNGDEIGYSGSLVCQVRQPEAQSSFRTRMEEMRRKRIPFYLRTPFGKLFMVSIGNLGWTPLAGTGSMEMGEMTIPYEEIR